MFEHDLILGRYKIIGKAGSGGYATVQHAFDTRLKRDVAIKCIKLSQADIAKARVSALNEGRVADFVTPQEPRVRPIGARAMSRAKPVEARSVYSKDRGSAGRYAASPAFISPENMPSEPGFLELRERAAKERAERRGFDRVVGVPSSTGYQMSETQAFGAQNIGHQSFVQNRGHQRAHEAIWQEESARVAKAANAASAARPTSAARSASANKTSVRSARYEMASDDEISALASILPGRIAGAGETAISAVDDDVVDVSPEFAAEARREAQSFQDHPIYADEVGSSSFLGIPSFLTPKTSADKSADNSQLNSQRAYERTGRSRSDNATANYEWQHNRTGQDNPREPGWQEGMDPFRGAYRGPTDNTMHFQNARANIQPMQPIQRRMSAKRMGNTMRFQSFDDMQGDYSPNARREMPAQGAQRRTPANAGQSYGESYDSIPGLEEARTAAHLNDANIVTVYDCVVEDDMAYVIMEYVEGKTLAYLLRQLGNEITLDMVASVFDSVSHALEVAHKANVLHLDIKPENVIVNADGVVKVTDFGLSTLMDAGGHGSTGGGTIGYMPLEQMRQEPLDVRTDEWALASLTYEMLSGTNPFRAKTLKEAEEVIEEAELVLPSLCWDEMDASVDDIMFCALDPDMDGRYDDIETFSQDLAPHLGDAKHGSAQLAAAVKESPEVQPKEEKQGHKVLAPLIDRIGSTGSSVLMRVLSALGCAAVALITAMNLRIDITGATAAGAYPDTTFGLFSIAPVVGWVLLIACAVVGAIKPKIGILVSYLAFVVMLIFNQAWLTALLLVAGCGVWWRFIGLRDDASCTIALMQPLCGAVGFAPIASVLAGALTDVKEATATAGFIALSAIAFASLGSMDLLNWEVYQNFVIAVNPQIAGASITNGLFETFANPNTWITAITWVIAAFVFSMFCRKGTRTFDIIGSVICAAILISGMFAIPLVMQSEIALAPLHLFGTFIPAALAILLAVLGVTDRVRMEDGQW